MMHLQSNMGKEMRETVLGLESFAVGDSPLDAYKTVILRTPTPYELENYR